MENVTYLIGAGASCQAMPLVANMEERMSQLLYWLDPNNGTSSSSNYKNETKKLHEKYKPIVDEAVKNKTPDTYAKKLWLNGSSEKLVTLKEFLNLYFLFEQDEEKTAYTKFPVYQDEANNYNPWKEIGKHLDDRYDVFLAAHLENINGKLIMPPNINIISWNYDNQWELSYKNFQDQIMPLEVIENLSVSDYNTYNNADVNKSNIIKLNSHTQFIGFDNSWMTFEKKLKETTLNQNEGFKDYDRITFAWEKKENQHNLLNSARKIIWETHKLVIIGYSFPNFNREVDKLLIESINNFTKIYIQVPFDDEYIRIKDRIQNFKSISDAYFKLIKDKDHFYIP